jgi:hypothetical protein
MNHLIMSFAVLAGCASVREYDAGNSDRGALYLDHASDECGSAASDNCVDRGCWRMTLTEGIHRLTIRRAVTIADCNGYGDCRLDSEITPVEEPDSAVFSVTPAEAATVDLAPPCDGHLTIDLTTGATGDFAIAVSVGSISDRWTFRAVDECEPSTFDCSDFDPTPDCCCQPVVAVNTNCPRLH